MVLSIALVCACVDPEKKADEHQNIDKLFEESKAIFDDKITAQNRLGKRSN